MSMYDALQDIWISEQASGSKQLKLQLLTIHQYWLMYSVYVVLCNVEFIWHGFPQ